MGFAEKVTEYLTGKVSVSEASGDVLDEVRLNVSNTKVEANGSIVDALVSTGLAVSNSDARRLMTDNAISLNGQKVSRENFVETDFQNGRLLLRRGKAFKDSALIEL